MYSLIITREVEMADKYQKDSKAASLKKHKEILARSAKISMFSVVAEPGGGVLAGTGVRTVSARLQQLPFLRTETALLGKPLGTEMPAREQTSVEMPVSHTH